MSGKKSQKSDSSSAGGASSQPQVNRKSNGASSSSSPSSSPPTSSSSPPPAQLTLLLHHATFRNDVTELTRLLETKTYDINSVDVNGNTALHIGVMLHHTSAVDLLLTHGAKVNLKNKNGFTPIHEAVSVGDREVLRKLWQHYKSRARESQELSGFIAHLHSIPQFQVKLHWRVQSWFPFIGRFLPADEIIISKKGNDVRIDTHMLEFVGMQWKHHPYSFLIKPKKEVEAEEKANEKDRSEKEAASPSPKANEASSSVDGDKSTKEGDKSDEKKEPFFIYSLDHELKVWQCVSTDDEKEKLELETKRKREQQEKAARQARGEASPSAGKSPSAAGTSSSGASSSSSSSSVPDVDLEYELDDFQDRPITSFFSPGRLKFTPVPASSWKSAWNGMKNMVSAWGSWAIGASSVAQQAKPEEVPVKTERVHAWMAEEWNVENIRIHTLKRYEHLTKEEIANLHARGAAFKSMLTNPLALKKKLQEEDEDSEEEEEEEGEEGQQDTEQQDGSQSIADAVDSQSEKQKKKTAKKPFEHRKSLALPPPTTVTFAQYFHKRNTIAYAALDMEELFEKERDEDLEKSINEAAAKGIKEEQIELKGLHPQEEGESSEGSALLHSESSADSQLEPSAAEIEAANQLAQQQTISHHHKLHHHSSASHHPLLLSEANSNNGTPYIHLGRAMVSDSSRKVYAGKVWMVPADEFPLKMETIINVVDLLFGTYIPSLVAKFKSFVTQELPRDRFPLRMHMPVFPAISFDLSIADFKQKREPGQAKLPTLKQTREGDDGDGDENEVDEPAGDDDNADGDDDSPILFTANNACCGTTDESTFFNIPNHYEREKQTEEELHKKQQRYRKRWKADQKRHSSKQ